MKITAITPGFKEPSTRFRIRQYIPYLKEKDIQVSEYWSVPPSSYKLPGALGRIRQRYIFPLSGAVELIKLGSILPSVINSYNSDLVWMNRPAHNLFHLEKYYKKPVLFDVDDAIWLNNEHNIKHIAKNVAGVIAGNSFIADWFKQYNQNVFVIPTAVNPDYYSTERIATGSFVIGWTGTSDNFKYLYMIEEALAAFLKRHTDAKLWILSNNEPQFIKLNKNSVQFLRWSAENEASILKYFNVGIMPLVDGNWERGKCSFKMLQYMAAGLPVIVSPVGMNKEVLKKGECGYAASNEKEWIEALESLYMNKDLRFSYGQLGRRIVEEHYSISALAPKLVKVFKNFNN